MTLDAGSLTLSTTSAEAPVIINLGSGELTLISGAEIALLRESSLQLTARNITLTGVINLVFAFQPLIFTVTDTLTLNNDITFPHEVRFQGGGTLALGKDITITAERFSMNLNVTAESAGNNNLSIITTAGTIGLTGDSINLGTGNLSLNSGGLNITTGFRVDITLTGRAISLTGPINRPLGEGSITINASRVLTLNSNINTGTGNITLTGGTGGIVLGDDITLEGGAISLTGAIDESASAITNGKGGRDSLTITASGVLTLGSSINLGTGGGSTLTITAERISAARITLTAASPISITFTGENIISPAQGFGGATALRMVTFVPAVVEYDFPPLSCPATGACVLGDGATAFTLPAILDIDDRQLTLDAGSEADITFSGEGPIRIEAATITIIARRLFIEDGRALTITAATGALTVNANIRSVMPSAITLTATSGQLTLGGGISVTGSMPTGNISLTGVDVPDSDGALITAGIVLDGNIVLNGAIISLSGSIAEPDDSPDNLTIMASGIMASGVITLNGDIALGAGNLTLNSTTGITLGSALTLTGADINLTRAITGTNDFTVNASGTLTLNGNITIGTAALSLTAGAGAISGTIGGSTDKLTAGTVSLTQVAAFGEREPFTFGSATSLTLTTAANQTVHGWMTSVASRALSLTSGRMITINADTTTGSGNLTLNGNMGIVLGANDITLTGGAIALTGVINASSNNYNFTITAMGGIALNSNINLGGGTLALTAGMGAGTGDISSGAPTPRTLTAGTVSLTQSGAFGNTALFIFATPTLNLTTAASQTVHDWMFVVSGRNLSLRSTTGGMITINADIATGSGDLTLNGANGIAFTSSRTLRGAAITLTGVIHSSGNDFTVTATGVLTLNSNITVRNLTLTAGTSSTGDIVDGTGTPTLTASTVSLTQASAFGGTALFTFAADTLNLETVAPQTAVHDWMVLAGRNLSLTSTGGAITIGRDIALGAGNLTLNGGTLVFSGAARTLSGTNITLTGDADSAVALTLTASGAGTLTLNSNIITSGATSNLVITGGTGGITTAAGIALTSGNNLTTSGVITTAATNGDLTFNVAGTITLGGNINLGTGTATLNAGSTTGLAGTSQITAMAINISFSNLELTRRADVPALDPDGPPTITFVGDDTVLFGARECDNNINCVIMGDGNLFVRHELTAMTSITIETTGAGSSVRFDGESTDTIMLTAPLVTIIADTINLEGRDLVIVHGAGGARLTLAGNVSGAALIDVSATGFIDIVGAVGARTIAGGGAVTLTAMLVSTVNRAGTTNTLAAHNLTITATDRLTIATAINISAGMLTLTAGMGGTGDIIGTSTPILTAGTVSLEQDGAFGDTAMFDFGAATSLTLTTGADQIVHNAWMAVNDRNLSVTSTGGAVIVNANINIAAGNITLNGMGGITLGGAAVRRLIGGVITLTGAIDTSSTNNVGLFARASGALTLNSDINTGMGALELTGATIFLRGGARTLAGAAVTLTGAVSATNTPLTITASGDITINDDINLGAGALTLTATGANIVDVDGVVPVLTASTVSLTQAGTFAADLFTLAAGVTSLTLDAGSAAQTVHAWIAVADRALSLTTTGAITIGRDIATGMGNLTLDGGTLTLTGRARTLSGADIALTGALTANDLALTITATGDITINDNIRSRRMGALTLTAGDGVDQQLAISSNVAGSSAHTDGRHGEPHAKAGTFADDLFAIDRFGHLIDP